VCVCVYVCFFFSYKSFCSVIVYEKKKKEKAMNFEIKKKK